MSLDRRPFDWVRFLVQFFFGAVFGGIAGFYLAASAGSLGVAIASASVMALIVGLVAGCWGDRFWESFRDGGLWNPFRWF
jgi:hypothetical protein